MCTSHSDTPFDTPLLKEPALYVGVRLFVYLVGCFGLMFLQWKLAQKYHSETFREGGIIETFQFCELIAAAIVFFAASRIKQGLAHVGAILCGFCLLAACREMDNFFDANLPVVSWRIGFLFLIIPAVYALRHRVQSRHEIIRFLLCPACVMLFTALVIILPAAQCIGHKAFLVNVLDAKETVCRTKELFEEALETLGYFVLLCSSIELAFDTLMNRKRD